MQEWSDDDDWSDEDDDEEEEWVEWCAVDAEGEEGEEPAAVRIPTSKWTAATYQQAGVLSCGVQEGGVAEPEAFFKPPLEFADRCAAPVSPLMQ